MGSVFTLERTFTHRSLVPPPAPPPQPLRHPPPHPRREMAAFRQENAWVEQSALFSALTEVPGLAGLAWWDWPEGVRDRHPAALEAARREHAGRIDAFIALQYLFDRFWKAVKVLAQGRGMAGGGMGVGAGGEAKGGGGGAQ